MTSLQNLYTILGVPPDADENEIKAAYRLGARRFHPDANPNPGAAVQFREIQAAYDVLSDRVQRARYDRRRLSIADRRLEFDIIVTPSKRVIAPLGEPQVLYMLAEIAPGRRETSPHETVLNLTLVIDRSTSMKGRRLEQVKAAAHKIIDTMSDRDIISIISFSDRAEVVVPSIPIHAAERQTLKAHISTMQASGGTEIMQGLIQGLAELHRHLSRKFVNHLVLLTDGRTYGDEEDCILLAENAAEDGITISGMGIGEEWNDQFLDKLASVTGGTSAYIDSSSTVTNFLQKQVRSLGQAFAERLQLSVAPDASMSLESAFKIAPSPMPLAPERQPMPLGTLEFKRPLSILLQVKLPPLETPGMLPVARFDVTGDILWKDLENYKAIADMTLEVSDAAEAAPPPKAILNALGKLTLYRMQEKAQEAIDAGNVEEATRKLEDLATRLLAGGQNELAEAAMSEARHVASTHTLSDEGSKLLKYGTRALLLPAPGDDLSTH